MSISDERKQDLLKELAITARGGLVVVTEEELEWLVQQANNGPIDTLDLERAEVEATLVEDSIEALTFGPLSGVALTLQERSNNYGKFSEYARITQNIKAAMVDSPNWDTLPPNMKEALEMVAHKAGRILNGDPKYDDSWHDIQGYCKLVEDYLHGKDV